VRISYEERAIEFLCSLSFEASKHVKRRRLQCEVGGGETSSFEAS